MSIVKMFETGQIGGKDFISEAEKIEYTPHKSFKGVYLKHLVKGGLTNNQISCHIVKVEPNCVLDTHKHMESFEIHEVIFGGGECRIADNKIEYKKGTIGVIPKGTEHSVKAGGTGLIILAKFTPALL